MSANFLLNGEKKHAVRAIVVRVSRVCHAPVVVDVVPFYGTVKHCRSILACEVFVPCSTFFVERRNWAGLICCAFERGESDASSVGCRGDEKKGRELLTGALVVTHAPCVRNAFAA